jgi:kynureninase
MGAAPRNAQEFLKTYYESWNEDGINAWEKWMPFVETSRDLVGRLLGAPGRTIAFHQNVSTLVHSVLGTFDWSQKKNKVLISELTFPTLKYCLEAMKGLGLVFEKIKSQDGLSHSPEDFIGAIDDCTALVILDHGIYRSSALIDVVPIIAAAHRKNTSVMVDVYQTVGMMPIDAPSWKADFVVGGSHKWLCGGPGASFLYIREDLLGDLHPKLYGWMAQKDIFAFDAHVVPAADARSFMTGSFGISSLYAARAGWEIILGVGPSAVRTKALDAAHLIIECAQVRGFKINSPMKDTERAGQVCVDFPGSKNMEGLLAQEKILVDYRPYCGLRISGHFYTEPREVYDCFEAIDFILKR